jgi:hypothetical protein
MPTKPCPHTQAKIAQTLFLGASVSSFTTNAGWGGQPSQLTVNLVEDEFSYDCAPDPLGNNPQPFPFDGKPGVMYDQFISNLGKGSFNHYYTCVGDACYIDKYTGNTPTPDTPVENKIIPGKVYYKLHPTLGLVSQYWTKPDPGFFGNRTRIDKNGVFSTVNEDSHPNHKYDIIDTPVYFKMGDFSFGGFVQSWNRSVGNSGKNYTVIVNSPQSILNSCYLIIDKYAGSLFSKSTFSTGNALDIFGSPKNYLGKNGISYNQTDIYRGAMPNVFNIYGFLESFGIDNFGVVRANENGISINKVLESLQILTSLEFGSPYKLDSIIQTTGNHCIKRAFSSFGRIISKCMQLESGSAADIYSPISIGFNEFGAVNPSLLDSSLSNAGAESPRCQFVLDISELLYSDVGMAIKRLPDDIRIQGPIITIGELINQIAEKTGQDTYVEMVPVVHTGKLYNIIKVKTISRLKQPGTNIIENTIKGLECGGYNISSYSIGKEKNETSSRAMLIGGQQQRLYQVKSYRLAYSQNNFVFNPNTGKFINYYSLADGPITQNAQPLANAAKQYGFGKIRFPNFNSTRNVKLNDRLGTLNPDFANYVFVLNDEDKVQKVISKDFLTEDTAWKSTQELRDGFRVDYGNYEPSYKLNHAPLNDPTGGGRWFPLYQDNICPFFGFVHDEELNIKTEADGTTDFRKVRPVWFDTWTGQIAVVVRVDELPQLNVFLNKSALSDPDDTGDTFSLPSVIQAPAPPLSNTVFNNQGPVSEYKDIEFFVLTESEIRAAIAGFDNFLVYSLSKTYKPDLIEMVRRAYYLQNKFHLRYELNVPLDEAKEIAFKETDWYWKLLGSNIAGDSLYPTIVYPDKNDGSQYIQEKALQDLKIIHKFITDIAKYYGKKYMVKPHNLRAYRDESFAGVAFPTAIGYGYVFGGAGNLTFNYSPTNDGAWEEYGNIIDDGIVVGGTQWYNLTDEYGKIKPLLGYNNNYNYDYIRHNKCLTANKTTWEDFKKENTNPYFSYNAWLTLYEHKTGSCNDSFVFPSLDLSSLGPTDYVVVDQYYQTSTIGNALAEAGINNVNIPSLQLSTPVNSYDAWNTKIEVNGSPLPRSKVYVATNVDENFVFLDPDTLNNPRILIDAPGINLSLSSEENGKDPNRTVLSNIAIEDLLIYMKTTQPGGWDYDWIRYMLNYVTPLTFDDASNPQYLGLYTISSNSTANNVELAPKAAHPFFAGIPIKSNQFVYGPWTNYPYAQGTELFPSRYNIYNAFDPTANQGLGATICSGVYTPITLAQTLKLTDNLITNNTIEIRDDLVPWNYGGMHRLDDVAFKEIETLINYQAVIETAQLDMPGLPLFNLGQVFSSGNFGYGYTSYTSGYLYKDAKNDPEALVDLSYIPGASIVYSPPKPPIDVQYKIIAISGNGASYNNGPIISNIQCSFGQQGITTTYTFRTYTRKLGLFNREAIERTKKLALADMQRNKKISQISQELRNVSFNQRKFLFEERLNQSQFGSAELSSKLFGWSPGMVLIGQANPLIDEPSRTPKYIEDFSLSSQPGDFNTKPGTPNKWSIGVSEDLGDTLEDKDPTLRLQENTSATTLKSAGRIPTTVQLYQRKEVEGQISKDYGMQSMMSLDGLLSPISFYPTYKNSTFSMSLYNTANCPFCNGTKLRSIKVSRYKNGGGPKIIDKINISCDACGPPKLRLNAAINTENAKNPINAITLNPVVVPYGEFSNINIQRYIGAHPEGKHSDISAASPGLGGQQRRFIDRMRHCIEIIGRGSVPPNKMKYSLETSRNLNAANTHPNIMVKNNLDYYDKDLMLKYMQDTVGETNSLLYDTNQRFFGFRGPMMMHAWGYDEDGYPIPNAADEPYAFDIYGRPKRFKLKKVISTTTAKFRSIPYGTMFALTSNSADPVFAKTFNNQDLPTEVVADPNKDVYKITIEDDYSVDGGFDPGTNSNDITIGYKGSIISKTQKFNNGKWSNKIKLNAFYLNWAERPDLWKVGPIDLHWDSNRRVWTAGGDAMELTPPYIITNSNDIDSLDEFVSQKSTKNVSYRLIYAVLEEDLIKHPDFDETFATRGFIDDVEFSQEPLLQGYRRLIYIKDKTGYSAPKGTKLLCRYNRFTGFYEPISKPNLTAKGKIIDKTTALIDAEYIQGRRSKTIPTLSIEYVNPLEFTINNNNMGIFIFINGLWTLSAINSKSIATPSPTPTPAP